MLASPARSPPDLACCPLRTIAVVPATASSRDSDELFTLVPNPADLTSSMVLITGPSRTADIEQILVRGVHGPGEVHVLLVDSETA